MRRYIAAFCLFVVIAEISAHAAEAAQVLEPPMTALCKRLHHTFPSADCPHKKHPGLPQTSSFDEMSNHCAVLGGHDNEPVWVNVREATKFERDIAQEFSRPPGSPFHPPKQS